MLQGDYQLGDAVRLRAAQILQSRDRPRPSIFRFPSAKVAHGVLIPRHWPIYYRSPVIAVRSDSPILGDVLDRFASETGAERLITPHKSRTRGRPRFGSTKRLGPSTRASPPKERDCRDAMARRRRRPATFERCSASSSNDEWWTSRIDRALHIYRGDADIAGHT